MTEPFVPTPAIERQEFFCASHSVVGQIGRVTTYVLHYKDGSAVSEDIPTVYFNPPGKPATVALRTEVEHDKRIFTLRVKAADGLLDTSIDHEGRVHLYEANYNHWRNIKHKKTEGA